LDSRDIDIINQIFKAQSWLEVTDEIVLRPATPISKGSIAVPTVKGKVLIDVYISEDFPLGKIEFICTNLKGYSHLMSSGLLCLTAAPAATLEDRLLLELSKLEKWVKEYYVNGKQDAHFEYYNFPSVDTISVVFEEAVDKEPLRGTHGHFTYGLLREFEFGGKNKTTWIAFDLGGRKCRWSSKFLLLFNKRFTGMWVYVKKPPLTEKRETILKWQNLLSLLSVAQTKFLNDEYKKLRSNTAFNGGFLLMCGYDIPAANGGTEIHWETIFVAFDDFPFGSRKIGNGMYGPKDLGKDVAWYKSHNASYDRMFGRGSLSRHLTEQKILIIGTGAIGSNLLEALVRGGCRFVDIRDGESTEPGNNSRGKFTFREAFSPKVIELFSAAVYVSPYVEINTAGEVQPMRKENAKYSDLKAVLGQYQVIFDCSTNKYVSIMLDGMELPGTVVNLSISDGAKQFCVVTGVGNIHRIKNELYNRISPANQEKFYVATGCWSPTFRASFVDISGLLMYALREINRRLEAGKSVESFYIDTIVQENGISYQLNYHV
jgi:hypothetical protein